MKSSLCFVGALAACLSGTNALPSRSVKRQQPLIDAFAEGRMAHFLGTKGSTPQLEEFAKLLGANDTFPGTLQSYMVDTVNDGYGVIPRKPTDGPEFEELKPRLKIPGSRTVRWRYGPFSVPNINIKNPAGEFGMLYNYPVQAEKACKGKCTLVGMTAGLEYRNGDHANINTGTWLHHMVIFNVGKGRTDATCKNQAISVPHTLVGATSRNSERIFASGNERTSFSFMDETSKAGYMLNEDDKFSLIVEFMNTDAVDKEVFMTVTYDVVDGHPEGWSHLRPVWLDIQQCGTSELIPDSKEIRFSEKYTWTSDIEGEVFGMGGHLHDGGTTLRLRADDKLVCDSKATYGSKPEFIQPAAKPAEGAMPAMGGHSHGDTSTKHISNMEICYGEQLPVKQMKKGQKWEIEAVYDFAENRGVQSKDGEQSEIMGIAIMFVKQKLET